MMQDKGSVRLKPDRAEKRRPATPVGDERFCQDFYALRIFRQKQAQSRRNTSKIAVRKENRHAKR
jgi:hypothetical protein